MMIDKEIASLKSAMLEALRKYREALVRYEDALIAAYPLKPGDVIKSSDGAMAKVISVTVKYGAPRYFAVRQNKDGKFGKKPIRQWRKEWEKPEKVT